MALVMATLAPHVPSICFKERAPEFQKPLVDGMKQVSDMIYQSSIDAIVLVSCHWMSTFYHYVDATPHHKGVLTALECPQLISDVPYSYPGDQDLGRELVKAGQDAGIPVLEVNDPTYIWDYGTVVPLRHLVPNEDIPVVDLCVTWAGSLDETCQWGKVIGQVIRNSNKRIAFVCSGALSHNLVRGREKMPTLSEQAMDKQFLKYLTDHDLASAWEMLPQYAKAAGVESGGRHLAMLFGVLEDGKYDISLLGEAQSSGSWNAVVNFIPQ